MKPEKKTTASTCQKSSAKEKWNPQRIPFESKINDPVDTYRQLAGHFDEDMQNLLYAYTRKGLNPGVVNFVAVQDAVQYGFYHDNNYLSCITTTVGALLVELEKRCPNIEDTNIYQGARDATRN